MWLTLCLTCNRAKKIYSCFGFQEAWIKPSINECDCYVSLQRIQRGWLLYNWMNLSPKHITIQWENLLLDSLSPRSHANKHRLFRSNFLRRGIPRLGESLCHRCRCGLNTIPTISNCTVASTKYACLSNPFSRLCWLRLSCKVCLFQVLLKNCLFCSGVPDCSSWIARSWLLILASCCTCGSSQRTSERKSWLKRASKRGSRECWSDAAMTANLHIHICSAVAQRNKCCWVAMLQGCVVHTFIHPEQPIPQVVMMVERTPALNKITRQLMHQKYCTEEHCVDQSQLSWAKTFDGSASQESVCLGVSTAICICWCQHPVPCRSFLVCLGSCHIVQRPSYRPQPQSPFCVALVLF